jgi:hypothetical protein
MARRKSPQQPPPEAVAKPEAGGRVKDAVAPRPPGKDPRPLIYLALDQVFVLIYVVAIQKVIPSRLPSATIHLWTIPACLQVMALGTAAVFVPDWRAKGRLVAIVGGSALLLSTIVMIVRVLASAAFLAGVYGAFGQAAATFAIVAVALVIEAVALLPIVQVKYLMSRAGRRAYS